MTSEIVPKARNLQIGACRYHSATGMLATADGAPVHLRKQSHQVLAALAARAGEVVSRDDLTETVWKGIATTDDSLIQCIGDIRRVLGKECIETFPKTGYRLVAEEIPPAVRVYDRPLRPGWAALAVGVFLTGLSGLGLWQFSGHSGVVGEDAVVAPPPIIPEKTLAVLPFVNLGGGEALQYFGDGLSEDLTTDLARIPDLTVIAYASSGDFPEAEAGFREIAGNLGARYLVRGTVRHSGDRVRINVSLIDPYDGVSVWAERYDRVRQDPFDLQEDVTRAIVDALSLSLEAETAPVRVAPDAYFMLLRGLEPLRKNTTAGNEEARVFFRRALELEPDYARAHAYLAVAYGRDTMFSYAGEAGGLSVRKGLEAAIAAIQLDPELPNAYLALAILNLAIREHDKALAAARHAIGLNRNFADGYAALAEAGVYGGDLLEALDAIRHAKRLHPHHAGSYNWIEGHIHFQLGNADAARAHLQEMIGTNPEFVPGLVTLAAVYADLGEQERAGSVLAAVGVLEPGFSIDRFSSMMPYAGAERRNRMISALESARQE